MSKKSDKAEEPEATMTLAELMSQSGRVSQKVKKARGDGPKKVTIAWNSDQESFIKVKSFLRLEDEDKGKALSTQTRESIEMMSELFDIGALKIVITSADGSETIWENTSEA